MDVLKDNAGIIGTVAAVIAIYFVWKALQPKKKVIAEDMMLNIKCRKCGWQGAVTKYNQVCRKCNSKELSAF
jgi:Zn finger protein HypA/HybF involved in hydrogenase expression